MGWLQSAYDRSPACSTWLTGATLLLIKCWITEPWSAALPNWLLFAVTCDARYLLLGKVVSAQALTPESMYTPKTK